MKVTFDEMWKIMEQKSGIKFEYEEIRDTELAKRADVLVTGKFVEALRCEGEMYGSANQRIIKRRIEK